MHGNGGGHREGVLYTLYGVHEDLHAVPDLGVEILGKPGEAGIIGDVAVFPGEEKAAYVRICGRCHLRIVGTNPVFLKIM